MKLELATEDLLTLYRHAKALNDHLSELLQNRMIIRCKVCNSPHKRNEPHIYKIKFDNMP